MKFMMKRMVVVLACLGVLILSLTPALAYTTFPLAPADAQVSNALNYLRGQQTSAGDIGGFAASAWVTMAIAAAGENPNSWSSGPGNPSIVDYLRSNVNQATSVTDYERMVLAITAAGENPSNFGGRDFLGLVQAAHDGTQIGNASLLNDDYWGVMALISAGISQNDPEVASTVAFIKSNQNADGGWSWGVGMDSDVDDTAAAIMALIAAGENKSSAVITNGLAYMKSMQMSNGGFNSWGSTNCDTDAWAVMAIAAAGQDPTSTAWRSGAGKDPVDNLLTFQQANGSFYWQSGTPGMSVPKTTANAIQALLGKPWPTNGYTTTVRIEKTASTLFSGEVTVYQSRIYCYNSGNTTVLLKPTALGALDKASQIGGFSYQATDAWGSPYVVSIDGEAAAGLAGWLYWVDYVSPSVGAGDFVLGVTTPPPAPHQEVLWAYGQWGQLPLQIASSKYIVEVNESFTITVTNELGPVAGATVYVDNTAQAELTNSSGQVTLSLGAAKTFSIRADKAGAIRSKAISVIAEQGSPPPPPPPGSDNGSVNLSATISPAIAINVTPASMVFESELYGNLGPRDISDPETLTVRNVGTWTLDITTQITPTSDSLFLQGIRVDGVMWDVYMKEDLARNQTMNASVTLAVPETYSQIGERTGVMIVWAAEAT